MNIQTWYSLRFVRWLFRLVWNRRVAWTLITLASLLALYYQWENRRSARELQAARERLLARIGTENWLDLAPPVVPDEQNFFALPFVEQWMRRDGRQLWYVVPENTFWPEDLPKPEIIENEADGTTRLDFAKWAANRDLKGESPEMALHRELVQSDEWLEKLMAGLARPFSARKPHQREEYAVVGANPYGAFQPQVSHVDAHMHALSLHLRIAAAAGGSEKARSTALILLRIFPESVTSHHWLPGSLVSIATHEIAFEALQDALSLPVWNENSLRVLQLQLGKINDLEVLDRCLSTETLIGYGVGIFIRESCRKDGLATDMLHFGKDNESLGSRVTRWAYIYGPTGWHDANTAFYLNQCLDQLGPKGETAWLDVGERYAAFQSRLKDEYRHVEWNMRRKIGAMAMPNIGNLWPAAAETLFHRRCLILACELEKYRMQHGVYPDRLPELKGFVVDDPARPGQRPDYRLESGGYTLRSSYQDWLWRMKRSESTPQR